MRKGSARGLALACLACWFAAAGCSRGTEPEREVRNSALPAVRGDTGVELRVMLSRDTIPARGRSAVEVLYFVVNGPAETTFNNDPGRFAFRVQRTDGRPVQPTRASPRATGSWGTHVRMVLPGGAVLLQRQDLRCITEDAGYGRIPTQPGECMIVYDLDEPGAYQVIVQYTGPDNRGSIDSLLADTVGPVDFGPRPVVRGRRMADTATLVVVP